MIRSRLQSKLAATLGLLGALTLPAAAAECPRTDALGTSRVLTVDAAATPRVGQVSFPETLDLQDREIVLTFDDGPAPDNDEKILAALAEECVRATFFLIGKQASKYPEWVRKIAAAGHTVAHHGWSHHKLSLMSPVDARDDIDKGIAAVEMALNGVSTTTASTPFFRYPYFEMSKDSLDYLEHRGMVVFGADLLAYDWVRMTPEQQLEKMIAGFNETKKGVFLLHDAAAQTAVALPAFLRYLRDNGYRVVHVVPAAPGKAAADLRQSEKRE